MYGGQYFARLEDINTVNTRFWKFVILSHIS